MEFRSSKKGSLSLSMEAIVIVVLAMTLLGLGLTFVRQMFGDISKTTSGVQQEIREKILDDLRTGNKKLAVPKTVNLGRKETTDIIIGIMNTESSAGKPNFGVFLRCIKKQPAPGATPDPAVDCKEVTFFYENSINNPLGPTDAQVIPVTVTAPATSGDYLYEAIVCKSDTPDVPCGNIEEPSVLPTTDIYARQSFFIRVT